MFYMGFLPGLSHQLTSNGGKGDRCPTSKDAHKPEHYNDDHDSHYGSYDTTHNKIPLLARALPANQRTSVREPLFR